MDLPAATPRLSPAQAALALPAAMLLTVAVFAPVPAAYQNPTLHALLDFGHFTLAAAGCWFLSTRIRWAGWAAFATVVAIAALCEVVQGFTGRCPSTFDFVRGLIGAFAVLISLSAFRPSVPPLRWIGASVIVVAISAWPISEFLLATAKFCIRVSASLG